MSSTPWNARNNIPLQRRPPHLSLIDVGISVGNSASLERMQEISVWSSTDTDMKIRHEMSPQTPTRVCMGSDLTDTDLCQYCQKLIPCGYQSVKSRSMLFVDHNWPDFCHKLTFATKTPTSGTLTLPEELYPAA
jgi:hypothetical protein